MNIAIVVARSINNVIGNGQDIPWHVKGEQKRFKAITTGGTLIMGRKTFESIGRPLPGRETIIVTRNPAYTQPGCHVATDLADALDQARHLARPVFIVGGGEIYRQSMDLADAVHLTTIQAEFAGDIYFPEFPGADFHLVREEYVESNIDYIYQYFERDKRDEADEV